MKVTKLVCLGDSLTEGFGVDIANRWTELLKEELNIQIVNKGISGDTTAGMLARFQTNVIDLNPSHVIILGGTNDISLRLKRNVILSNILAMVKVALNADITPILGIPTSCFAVENANLEENKLYRSSEKMHTHIYKYQELLKHFAQDRNLDYIDFSINLNTSDYLEDNLHPNKKGHLKMMYNAKEVILNSNKNEQQ